VPDIYLHIGLAKTGTSHLQQVLWLNRERLGETGVLIPGETRLSQTSAVWDLMGRRLRGPDQPEVAGAWSALVAEAVAWSGSHVVISEEFLANATPRQVRRAVRAFAPAVVHVIVTARDVSQVVGSSWQQELAKGQTWTWAEYVAAVRDPENGPATAGVAFWLRHDLVRVLDAWEVAVPRERIHLVTVPPPDAPRELLLRRFAAAARLDPAALVENRSVANVSIGVVEAEVLRRLNVGLDNRLSEQQYIRAVQRGVQPALRSRPSASRPIRPAADDLDWATRRATSMVDVLRSRGYDVAGDLDDLVPRLRPDHPDSPDAEPDGRPDNVAPDELADAALDALVAMTEKYAELWWRTRRRDRSDQSDAGLTQRWSSRLRATGYRARITALGVADRSRLANRAVNAYIRRSSRR
jgi:hypothetical protein